MRTSIPRLRYRRCCATAHEYWTLNRLAVCAGARTLAHRLVGRSRQAGWSLRYEGIVELMALGTPSHDIHDPQAIRGPLDKVARLARPLPLARAPVQHGTWQGEWMAMPCWQAEPVILFLHGGGYVSGSPASHRALIAYLAHHAETRVFALDYRLAPEHPFPAAIEDAWEAYWWLLCQGIAPAQIVVAGDSAGGGLTVALLLALREAGMPLPAAGVCLSPWMDLALTGASLRTQPAADYLNLEVLRASARMYLAGHDAREPLASPLYADLRGLPPLLLQAGSAERLLDDSRRFTRRAQAAGVDVELELWPGMVHVWHFTYRIEPMARQAVQNAGRFIRRQLRGEYDRQQPSPGLLDRPGA